MGSCTRTCQLNGKQCRQRDWHTYSHEVDTYAEIFQLVDAITGLSRSQNPGAEKAFYRTYDSRRHTNFTTMGGGTTATAQHMYSGSELTAAGIGSPWNNGVFCAEDLGESDSFMTPAVHYIGSLGPGYQCRYNIPNRNFEQDQCERHYHGASWRRLCVCDDPDVQPDSQTDSTVCLRLGLPDPECCSRPSEASCADGFQYRSGPLCMWSHDHDYFTTECRRLETTTTTTLPSYAEGYFLSPRSESNCTAVCEVHGMTCTAEGWADAFNEISNATAVSRIIAAIGHRDWLGLNKEMIYPQCLRDRGHGGYRIWPGTWGNSMNFFDCYHFNPRGDVPADYCDPADAPTNSQSWRRLCKCLSTTTMFPAGYELAGTDAMCTDEANTPWNGGIEVGRWPRSHQPSIEACAQRCDDTEGCHGFGYWPSEEHCRTYRACTHRRCEGCHEYRGSLMARRAA